jgi:hypothetical protein
MPRLGAPPLPPAQPGITSPHQGGSLDHVRGLSSESAPSCCSTPRSSLRSSLLADAKAPGR